MSVLAFIVPLLVHVLESEGPKAAEFLVKELGDKSPVLLAWLEAELKKLK